MLLQHCKLSCVVALYICELFHKMTLKQEKIAATILVHRTFRFVACLAVRKSTIMRPTIVGGGVDLSGSLFVTYCAKH
jgi:hypothetical protein